MPRSSAGWLEPVRKFFAQSVGPMGEIEFATLQTRRRSQLELAIQVLALGIGIKVDIHMY